MRDGLLHAIFENAEVRLRETAHGGAVGRENIATNFDEIDANADCRARIRWIVEGCVTGRAMKNEFACCGIARGLNACIHLYGPRKFFLLLRKSRCGEKQRNSEKRDEGGACAKRLHGLSVCPAETERKTSSVEIKVADRFFDRLVLGFLQAFGELSREHVFLCALRFDGLPELRLDALGLLLEQARGVVEINGRWWFRRWNVREHDAEFRVNCEFGLATRAIDFD